MHKSNRYQAERDEMIRESTDPEPDPAESKCEGSTWTVLISVIVCDDDGDLRENASVSRCHPAFIPGRCRAFRCFVNIKSGDRVTLVH